MADQNITALPKKTSSQMAATDYLLGIDSAEGYQMLIQDLGDYIIQHATSSLAGANQTLAAAVNALNSKITLNPDAPTVLQTESDYDTVFANSATGILKKAYGHQTTANFPTLGGGFHTLYQQKNISAGKEFGYQVLVSHNTSGSAKEVDIFARCWVNGTASSWKKLPSRTEIDLITRNLGNPNTAGFHNAIYRGNNITSYLTDGSLWDRIKGTNGYALFDDLFLGDYITVGNNSYAIVDFDYYLRTGPVEVTEHHLVMMPIDNMNIPAGTVLYGSSDTLTLLNGNDVTYKETGNLFKWNATAEAPNTHNTNGGYKYSRIRTVIMKAADTIIVNAFGASHVKPIIEMYPNPSSASASGIASASGWTWFNSDDWSDPLRKSICDLPNETQIYGQQVWGRGSAYTNVGTEIGIDKFQFAICVLQRRFVNNRAIYYLRSVNSETNATSVHSHGIAGYTGSSNTGGVRPRFVLVG